MSQFEPLPVPLVMSLDLDLHHFAIRSPQEARLLDLDFDMLPPLVRDFVKVILNATALQSGHIVQDLTFYVDPCESVHIEYAKSAFGPIELLLKKLPDMLYAFVDGIVNIAILHELDPDHS